MGEKSANGKWWSIENRENWVYKIMLTQYLIYVLGYIKATAHTASSTSSAYMYYLWIWHKADIQFL